MVSMIIVTRCSHVDIMKTLSLGLMVWMVNFQVQIAAASFCDDNIFLRAGHQGVVSCDFGKYDVAGWLEGTNILETAVPFISLEGSVIHQPASGNEEYSMLLDGSLVIKNVTYNHEKNYTARVYKNGAVFQDEVLVNVYVLPVPEYPVVNGRADQRHVVVQSSNGKASLNCTMDHIRPVVPLELVVISNVSNGISMTTITSTLSNPDGTYDVLLDTQLKIGSNLPIGIYFFQCRVAEKFAHLFPSISKIDLLVDEKQYKFPSVNGVDNQQHVVLHVNREGTLTCSMDQVSPNVNLQWMYTNHDSSTSVTMERQTYSSVDNGDGTYNITSITNYKATSDAIQCVNLKCVVSGKAAQLYPLYTTVELFFPESDSSSNTSHSNLPLVLSVACVAAVIISSTSNSRALQL